MVFCCIYCYKHRGKIYSEFNLRAHLYRIHKTLLHFVEHNDSGTEKNDHKHETIDEPPPAYKTSGPQESVLEGFDDGGDGVKAHQLVDRDAEIPHAAGLAERIHDRGSIHPKLDEEGEQDLQIPVFGRHG